MNEKRFICVILIGLVLLGYVVLFENVNQSIPASQMVNERKKIALTFDDGPNYTTTTKLLDGLRERGIKATFFLVGERVEYSEEVVLQMSRDGHLIGNHTYTHALLTELSMVNAQAEISRTNAVIEKITGTEVVFIRPPCGCWNEELFKEVDMIPVFWDVDPKDWCNMDVGAVVENVINSVDDGDIILFHDIYDSSVVAALEVADRLMDMGYEFVTVDRILLE